MTRRIISVALIVLGVIAIALAIASATVWRASDTATLSLPQRPESAAVVTDPGVLDTVAPDVTVRATADDGQPVLLAVGRTEDVDAWLGGAAHQRVTGLSSWEELSVEDAGESTDPLPDPAGSDLWVAQQSGTGSAELVWEDRDGRWSLLAATDGTAPAPDVTLSWPVEVETPWLVPGIVVGALLLLVGLTMLILDVLSRREAERARARRAPAGQGATVAAAAASRRELRERTGEQERMRQRREASTGELPVVAGATGAATAADKTAVETAAAGTSASGATAPEVAGAARGAGIIPASPRAAELRAGRDAQSTEAPAGAVTPADATDTADADATTTPAGVARGAGIVPASDRAAEFRAMREPGDVANDAGDAVANDSADDDEKATAGEQPADRAGEGPEQREVSAGWRAMWGFGQKKDDTEEQR